jgi:hypothetical protein
MGRRLYPAHVHIGASGASSVLSAATAPEKHFIHNWSMSVDGAQDVILFEYGTGSILLDALRGTAEGAVSNMQLENPGFELGSGSALYIGVAGTANASATVWYSTRD